MSCHENTDLSNLKKQPADMKKSSSVVCSWRKSNAESKTEMIKRTKCMCVVAPYISISHWSGSAALQPLTFPLRQQLECKGRDSLDTNICCNLHSLSLSHSHTHTHTHTHTFSLLHADKHTQTHTHKNNLSFSIKKPHNCRNNQEEA